MPWVIVKKFEYIGNGNIITIVILLVLDIRILNDLCLGLFK